MCAYLKNMGGYKHNQLKRRSYEETQKLFDKAYKQVNSFVPMDLEVVKSSVTRTEGKMKKHIEVVKDDEVAIDAIPLATKPPMIVEYKIVKEGKFGYYQAKHENTRPEEDYKRVLWGDLKVMFKPDIKSKVWRNLQGYKVTVWKLFDTGGVHFLRFKNIHIFMLVEKRYPLTPITIINMLNKKLQADHWNEMCYQ
ncbi:hypothetical protein Tco_0053614 [Tanacetum coccineum]